MLAFVAVLVCCSFASQHFPQPPHIFGNLWLWPCWPAAAGKPTRASSSLYTLLFCILVKPLHSVLCAVPCSLDIFLPHVCGIRFPVALQGRVKKKLHFEICPIFILAQNCLSFVISRYPFAFQMSLHLVLLMKPFPHLEPEKLSVLSRSLEILPFYTLPQVYFIHDGKHSVASPT